MCRAVPLIVDAILFSHASSGSLLACHMEALGICVIYVLIGTLPPSSYAQ
jgi:hypothetical protein